MVEKTIKRCATISSENLSAVNTVLEHIIGDSGSIKQAGKGFEVVAELKGESARDLNRMMLSEMRRVEKKTSIRSQWTYEGTTEKFFDYALKQSKKV